MKIWAKELDSKILKFGQFGKTDILYMETNSGGLKDILLNQTFKHDNSTLSSDLTGYWISSLVLVYV